MNIKNQFTLFEQRRKIWLANQILTIIIDFFCMYSIKFFKKIKYRRFINLYSEQYRLKEKMLSRVVSDLAHFLKDGAKVKYVLSEIKSPVKKANTVNSRAVACPWIFKLLMKGKFDPYVL